MMNHGTQLSDRNGPLEQRLIEDYFAARGHTRQSLAALSAADAGSLLRAASEYASLRLAEMEAKAHYVDEIRRR
jgi:hypothetical protein